MPTDRVSRLAIGSGRKTEYMRPCPTSLRRFYLDDSKRPGTAPLKSKVKSRKSKVATQRERWGRPLILGLQATPSTRLTPVISDE